MLQHLQVQPALRRLAVAFVVLAGVVLTGTVSAEPAVRVTPPGGRPYTETWQQMVDRDRLRLAEIASGLRPVPALRRIREHNLPPLGRIAPQDDPGLVPAAFRRDAAPTGGVRLAPLAPQVPAVGWAGISLVDTSGLGTGAIPPDTSGAIGPEHFLEIVNGAVAVYSRSGVRISIISDTAFFTVVSGGITYPQNGNFDPRVIYDRRSGRFLACELEFGSPAQSNNHIILAVSRTADPLGVWDKYIVQVGKATSKGVSYLTDYDTLGTDDNGVYFGVTIFPSRGNPWLRLFATRKASLLASSPSLDALYMLDDLTDMYASPQPAHNQDPVPAGGRAWYVSSSSTVYANVNARYLTWPTIGDPTFSSMTEVATPAYGGSPPLAPAMGSTTSLDTGDDRLHGTVIRNGVLWTSRNVGTNAAGGSSGADRCAAEWLAVDVTGAAPARIQSGRIYDTAATSPLFYYYPTVMPSGQGHAAVAFSDSNGSRYAGAATAGRLAADTAGVLQAITSLADGVSTYNQVASGRNRWGDYSYTSLDPLDDMSIWTVQEYAGPVANSWGTRIAKLVAPAPTLSAPSGSAVAGATGADLALVGTGFYDPGPGYAGRLVVALTGGTTNGIANNRVTYTGPTSASVQFDIAADATPGPRTVVLTNPDGQSVSASGGFTVLPRLETGLAVGSVEGAPGETVALAARLTRTDTGSVLGGQPISFSVDGVEVAGSPATTGTDGVASVGFDIPADAGLGSHLISASFAGGATLNPAAGSADLAVAAPTSLAVPEAAGPTGSTVILSATLARADTGSPVADGSVRFSVGGVEVPGSPVTTNSSGLASLAYVVPAGSVPGTSTIGVQYAGSGEYRPSTGAAGLTTTPGLTKMYAAAPTPRAQGAVIRIYSYLQRSTDSANLPGRTVAYRFNGLAAGSAVTDVNGYSEVQYLIPASTPTGSVTIEASFAGDSLYEASVRTNSATVLAGTATSMSGNSPSGGIGSRLKLYAYLYQTVPMSPKVMVAGKGIDFFVDGGKVGTGQTDANGYAQVTWQVPSGTAPGSHSLLSRFVGDSAYGASSRTGGVTTSALYGTSVSMASRQGVRGLPVALYCYLWKALDGSMLAGRSVTFQVDGTEVGTGTTDTNGYAACSYLVPSGATIGVHAVGAAFAGDASLTPGTGSTTLTVAAKDTLAWAMPSFVGAMGSRITLYTYLKSAMTGALVAGKTVTFRVDGVLVGSAVSTSTGYAAVAYTVPTGASSGAHTVLGEFAGDAIYSAGAKTSSLTVP